MQNKSIHYFVEGDCEKKFIDSYKVDPYKMFITGKVSVFNFIKEKITINRLMMLNPNTIIILVYDIDVDDTHILEDNLKKLKKYGFNKVYHIQSIHNFEDEIVYSSDLKNINDLFRTQNVEEFKTEFIRHKDIVHKLGTYNFKPNKMWSRENRIVPFNKYSEEKFLKFIKNVK